MVAVAPGQSNSRLQEITKKGQEGDNDLYMLEPETARGTINATASNANMAAGTSAVYMNRYSAPITPPVHYSSLHSHSIPPSAPAPVPNVPSASPLTIASPPTVSAHQNFYKTPLGPPSYPVNPTNVEAKEKLPVEEAQPIRTKRKFWIIFGAVLLLVIVVALGAGLSVAKGSKGGNQTSSPYDTIPDITSISATASSSDTFAIDTFIMDTSTGIPRTSINSESTSESTTSESATSESTTSLVPTGDG